MTTPVGTSSSATITNSQQTSDGQIQVAFSDGTYQLFPSYYRYTLAAFPVGKAAGDLYVASFTPPTKITEPVIALPGTKTAEAATGPVAPTTTATATPTTAAPAATTTTPPATSPTAKVVSTDKTSTGQVQVAFSDGTYQIFPNVWNITTAMFPVGTEAKSLSYNPAYAPTTTKTPAVTPSATATTTATTAPTTLAGTSPTAKVVSTSNDGAGYQVVTFSDGTTQKLPPDAQGSFGYAAVSNGTLASDITSKMTPAMFAKASSVTAPTQAPASTATLPGTSPTAKVTGTYGDGKGHQIVTFDDGTQQQLPPDAQGSFGYAAVSNGTLASDITSKMTSDMASKAVNVTPAAPVAPTATAPAAPTYSGPHFTGTDPNAKVTGAVSYYASAAVPGSTPGVRLTFSDGTTQIVPFDASKESDAWVKNLIGRTETAAAALIPSSNLITSAKLQTTGTGFKGTSPGATVVDVGYHSTQGQNGYTIAFSDGSEQFIPSDGNTPAPAKVGQTASSLDQKLVTTNLVATGSSQASQVASKYIPYFQSTSTGAHANTAQYASPTASYQTINTKSGPVQVQTTDPNGAGYVSPDNFKMWKAPTTAGGVWTMGTPEGKTGISGETGATAVSSVQTPDGMTYYPVMSNYRSFTGGVYWDNATKQYITDPSKVGSNVQSFDLTWAQQSDPNAANYDPVAATNYATYQQTQGAVNQSYVPTNAWVSLDKLFPPGQYNSPYYTDAYNQVLKNSAGGFVQSVNPNGPNYFPADYLKSASQSFVTAANAELKANYEQNLPPKHELSTFDKVMLGIAGVALLAAGIASFVTSDVFASLVGAADAGTLTEADLLAAGLDPAFVADAVTALPEGIATATTEDLIAAGGDLSILAPEASAGELATIGSDIAAATTDLSALTPEISSGLDVAGLADAGAAAGEWGAIAPEVGAELGTEIGAIAPELGGEIGAEIGAEAGLGELGTEVGAELGTELGTEAGLGEIGSVAPELGTETGLAETGLGAETGAIAPEAPYDLTATGFSDSAPGTVYTNQITGVQEIVLDNGTTVNLADYQAAVQSGQSISVDGMLQTGTSANPLTTGAVGDGMTIEVSGAPYLEGTAPAGWSAPEGYQLATYEQTLSGLAGESATVLPDGTMAWLVPSTGLTAGEIAAGVGGAAVVGGGIAAAAGGGAGAAGGTAAATGGATGAAGTGAVAPAAGTEVGAVAPTTTPTTTPTTGAPSGTTGTTAETAGTAGVVGGVAGGTAIGSAGAGGGAGAVAPSGTVTTGGATGGTATTGGATTGGPVVPEQPPAPVTSTGTGAPGETVTNPAGQTTTTPLPEAEQPPAPVTESGPPQSITTEAQAAAAGYDLETIAKWLAAGLIVKGMLTPPPQPDWGSFYAGQAPWAWGTGIPVTGTGGINPGYIMGQTPPHYTNAGPGQNQYYWGTHPTVTSTTNVAGQWNNVPNAPVNPFGQATSAVGGTQHLNVPQFVQQTMTPQYQAATTGSSEQYPFIYAPATPVIPGQV